MRLNLIVFTLLILPACLVQLQIVRNLLHLFLASTGLKINFSKSSMVPINVTPKRC
jgi:hypothetical protein